ncbi:uncharacterized protein LOC131624699 [Vicia villosa]|uniref:uncharacterized protein LOC131624699 n=1 Tax=Vicia villosa TaxID=3911 RepID=UPI00273C3308|nr:uncharacterized protein LOC131624699 [Vicia villosa]
MELSNTVSVINKGSSSVSSNNMGSFPSPGAPYYRERTRRYENNKGWSSERVSKQTNDNGSRRHTMSGLTPFSGGRTMPSKWDEAERWICSPVSASYADSRRNSRTQQKLQQRRPKSISGPIVPPLPPGVACYSNYSPLAQQLRQGFVVRNLMVSSPFSTGVLAPVAVSVRHYEEHDGNEESERSLVPRYDKGTQMSPTETENDVDSSPKSSATSAIDQEDCYYPKLEVRDVEVDSEATVMRGSKRHGTKSIKNDLMHRSELRENSVQVSDWDIEESTLDTSKLRREEAKIAAWENLQKAKAEAAMRKLEMKLEKKRSSTMDKILKKLRRAQLKAESMRSLVPVQQEHHTSKICKVFSFPKYVQMRSLSSCFSSQTQ